MDHYPKYVLASICAGAAVVAYAFSFVHPANFAAMFGGIFGLAATQRLDNVSNKFKTDVERILQPNEPAKLAIVGTATAVLLTISALAGVMHPALAAPLGLLIGLVGVEKIWKK